MRRGKTGNLACLTAAVLFPALLVHPLLTEAEPVFTPVPERGQHAQTESMER